jgi:hypothetical protein
MLVYYSHVVDWFKDASKSNLPSSFMENCISYFFFLPLCYALFVLSMNGKETQTWLAGKKDVFVCFLPSMVTQTI